MKIKNIMSRDVEIVSPATFLHDVAQKMRKSDCGTVMVAEADKLMGIITDRDIAIRCIAEEHHPSKTTAGEIMSSDVLYCQDTDEAADVAATMAQNRLRRIVVLNAEKHMVGMVSLGDLSMASNDHNICGTILSIMCHPDLKAVPLTGLQGNKLAN